MRKPKNLLNPKRVHENAAALEAYLQEGGRIQSLLPISAPALARIYHTGYQRYQNLEFTKARLSFALLTFLAPQNKNYWLALGSALIAEERFNEAVTVYEMLVTEAPSSSHFQLLAFCYQKLGQTKKAQEALKSAAKWEGQS